METLQIVDLIENNPIIKLSKEYNNKFLIKIKERFTEMEQQLFVSSFYCYLNYNQNTDFVIDLDNIWKWLGFSIKVNAKILLEKHFIINKDYKFILLNNQEQKKGRGGHNKDTIMLTIKAFKLFCIKAETKKANDIHEYYIKLEEIIQEMIQDESNELKQQLEYIKNEIIVKEETNKQDFDKKIEKEREQMLLREFGSIGAIVYIIKVKSYENKEYVIKIGESRKGVQSRYNEHKSKYGDILLLDCFSVKKSKEFETFLHSHTDIKFNRVTDLTGHENEKELFLVGKNLTYKTVVHIITTNIKYYNEYTEGDFEKLKVENYMLKQIIECSKSCKNESDVVNINSYVPYQNAPLVNNSDKEENKNNVYNEKPSDTLIIQELLTNQREMLKKIDNLEKTNKLILEKLNVPKTTTNFNEPLSTLGPRLQQINPENMSIIKVYESVSECMKEFNYKIKRPSINKAISENTVYQGFRWLYIDREKDPTTIEKIEDTKQTKIQNLGYIAKLNKEKTEILHVYLDRKTAAIDNNYPSHSSLDYFVKNSSITNNHYYMLYDKCSDELRDSFVKVHGEPILYKNGIGQFDSENKLVQEFVCKYDCIKKLHISDKSLTKALDNNIMYNDFYYKKLDMKDKI